MTPVMQEVESLVRTYHGWLKDRTILKQVKDYIEVTTPFLDRDNDALQLYVRSEGTGFRLTDAGEIISGLEFAGCELNTPKRKKLLELTVNGFGVKQIDGRLEVVASRDDFALRKHNLIQAMLAVNDMFFTTASSVGAGLFMEDVASWLDSADIRYIPSIRFTGRSGFSHSFDFVVPRSRYKPERVLRTITNPSRDAAQNLIMAWLDTRSERPAEVTAYAILNDRGKKTVPSGVPDALVSYGIQSILWNAREQVREELAA